MLKYKLYIKDILRAIKDIDDTMGKKNFDSFAKDKNLVDATAMRIQIIGESSKKLPQKIKQKIKKVRWDYIEGLRNVISHAYFKISPDLLWDIVKEEVPLIKSGLKNL